MPDFLPLIVVAVAGVILVATLVAGAQWFPGTRPVWRTFHCPFRDQNVTVEFEENVWDGKALEVRSCSCFPLAAVTCERRCLRLAAFPSPRLAAVPATPD